MTEPIDPKTEQQFLNCDLEFECPKDWFELEPTNKAGIKFCNACQKNVYLCQTEDELHTAEGDGQCIAYFADPSRSTRFRLQREKVQANKNDPDFEPIVLMGLPRRRSAVADLPRGDLLKLFVDDKDSDS